MVLSHFQVEPMLQAGARSRETIFASLDLNLTTSEVYLHENGIVLPDGQSLTWHTLELIADDEVGCYHIEGGQAKRIQVYSEDLDRSYSLMPTPRAPALLISGLPMHRIKGIDPREDTLRKIRTLSPVRGHVLDTATGLGYTAIEVARTAEQVTTIELDPAALQIARLNPWSHPLFADPRIRQIVGDSAEEVAGFEENVFSCVIHDPPTISLAGELYSAEFYRQLFRVLRRPGKVFHYIGDLESPSGRRVSKGVTRRLREVGFTRIVAWPDAFGVTACK